MYLTLWKESENFSNSTIFYAYGLAEFDITEFVSLKLFIGPSIFSIVISLRIVLHFCSFYVKSALGVYLLLLLLLLTENDSSIRGQIKEVPH